MSIYGNWRVITAHSSGEPMPDGLAETMRLTLTETSYHVSVAGIPDKGDVQIDDTVSPPRLTITGTDGPNAGNTLKAIYDLQGNTLTISYDRSGSEFPTDFESQAGRDDFVARYKREQ